MTQATQLSERQIDDAYLHFEHGSMPPKGVVIDSRGFRHTMGRVWIDTDNGLRSEPI